MRNEKISYILKCSSKGNAFEPNLFTEEKFIELGIVQNSDEIQIAHPGELVSYFKINEKSTLKVNRNEFSISTYSLEELKNLFESIKVIYAQARLNKIDFEIEEHFIDKKYPKLVFDKFVVVEGMKLDVFRYKKDDLMFLLYNCHPSQMHLKIELNIKFQKPIKYNDLDFHSGLKINTINENRDLFINAFLN